MTIAARTAATAAVVALLAAGCADSATELLADEFELDGLVAADVEPEPDHGSVRWQDGRPTHIAWRPGDGHCLWATLGDDHTATLVSAPAGDEPCTGDGAADRLDPPA